MLTPEERARAKILVHDVMLEQLWIRILEEAEDPIEEARASESIARIELEKILSATAGRDADLTQHVATEMFDRMWRAIMDELANRSKPIALD